MILRGRLLAAAAALLLVCGRPAAGQSVRELRVMADQGDALAAGRLCHHFWKGQNGEEPNYDVALKYCRAGAQGGDPRAQTVLGAMYSKGQGVGRDPKEARRLFCLAAQQRFAPAMDRCYDSQNKPQPADFGDKGVRFKGARTGIGGQFGTTQLQGPRFNDEDRALDDALSRAPAPGSGGIPPEFAGQIQNLMKSVQLPPVPTQPPPGPPPHQPSVPAPGEVTDIDRAMPLISGPRETGRVLSQDREEPPTVSAPAAEPVPGTAAADYSSPPAPRRRPLLPIALVLAGPILVYLGYRFLVVSSCNRIPQRIRLLIQTQPLPHQDIAASYCDYCARGGTADVFSGEELLTVVASLDETGSSFPAPGLSLPKALDLAVRLAAAGKAARVQDVLSDPVLQSAAVSGRAEEALGILAKSGNLDNFVLHFSGPGRAAGFYSSYSAGLLRLGRVEQSFRMLSVKPLEHFTAEDQTLLLELHVKLGHFDQASLLLSKVADAKPPEAAKEFYEELAKQATMKGGERLAQDIRTMVAGKPLPLSSGKPAVPAGRVLAGKYELRQLISSGGMGEVYEGYDRSLDRRVAVKRMLPGLLADAGLRDQFLREAKTAAHLSHPYIVPIYECLESGGDLYLVFEFVKGETLAQLLARRSRLSLKECQGIFHYVCHAVDYAHRKRVLHRDLKPANIMLDENGISRVMDFGIAIEVTGTLSATFVDQAGVTGTLRYMPPEQHYGKTSRVSDVYSLGICLYEGATGYLPFNASTLPDVIAQKHKGEFPPPSFHIPQLPKEFDLLLRTTLNPDPKLRVQSALEFYELLAKIPS